MSDACPQANPETQLTLSVGVSGSGGTAWPAVQVLFALETTPFDGVFDTSQIIGTTPDQCMFRVGYPGNWTGKTPCGESNGVPFFVANAGAVAESIQATHPDTNVTFGLIDFGAAYDNWDDSNGAVHDTWPYEQPPGCPPFPCSPFATTGWDSGTAYEYHVDVGSFVPAAQFQSRVTDTFQRTVLGGGYYIPGTNESDNFLHSSSITALYGALMGQGLGWRNSTHHVIVWIGSTAPRAAPYVQNYCVTPSYWAWYLEVDWGSHCLTSNNSLAFSPSCEPSYNFSGTWSPDCEGWVNSEDGNANDSIAALSRSSPSCRYSLGSSCTIDMVDLYAMGTNPNSWTWWSYTTCNSNPANRSLQWACLANNTWWAYEDVHRVVSAGCDLANATGGTWDGPVIDNCGTDRWGTLDPASPENYSHPVTSNPTLLAALTNVGLGDPPSGLLLRGMPQVPMFRFVPWGNFHVDLSAPTSVSCASVNTMPVMCDTAPSAIDVGGVTTLTWNWSEEPNLDALYAGDVWTASLYVYSDGPPYSVPSPVDACVTVTCLSAGSGSVNGTFTAMTALQNDGSTLEMSFPLTNVTTLLPQAPIPPSIAPPPSPPTGSGPPVLNPSPLPVATPQPIAIGLPSVGVAVLSLQAVAAGILAAGLTRIAIRPRRVRMAIAVPLSNRRVRSKFDPDNEGRG